MDIDDDKYLQNISPGPTTPSQIHLQQLEPVLIGGDDMLDPIKEEVPENMTVEQLQMMEASGSHHHMFRHGVDRGDKGTFWPEKPRVDHIPGRGAAEIKASTVLTNLQRGNIPTIMQTVVEPVIVAGPHQKAGQGELRPDDLVENDVNEKDASGRTPLMWSAYYGQSPTITLLMRHGAYVRANGYENETAVHLAASNGHHDAIRILINHGAEVDAVDENQCTPLMFAAMQNHPHCVNELLINGADFTQTDFNGDNALSLAMQNDSKQAQRVLENHILAMLKGLVTGKETID